jgi:hypothetical protein
MNTKTNMEPRRTRWQSNLLLLQIQTCKGDCARRAGID